MTLIERYGPTACRRLAVASAALPVEPPRAPVSLVTEPLRTLQIIHHCTAASLPQLAQALDGAERVGLDIETTGLNPVVDKPRLVQLALADGIHVIDLFQSGTLGPVARALEAARVVGHNLLFDLSFLRHHYGVAPTQVADTMLASQLVDGGRFKGSRSKGRHSLAAVCQRVLGKDLDKSAQCSDWSAALSPEQLDYAARDAFTALEIHDKLTVRLQENGLSRVARLEFDALPALVAMQHAGVRLDVDAWSALAEQSCAEGERLAAALRTELEIENPASNPQVLAALRRRGLDLTGTSASELAQHARDPFVRHLIAMRKSASFAARSAKMLDYVASSPDGRVRTHWRQLGAATGRATCSAPSLLNLPRDSRVRACIVPAPGHVFVVADYAAIELRVLAHVTGDVRLCRLFDEGGDPHRELAAVITGKAVSEITPDERSRAKPANFGFVYGMGPAAFASYSLAGYGQVFSPEEADRFRKLYLKAYPGVARWQQRIHRCMPRVVLSTSGRARYFDQADQRYTERLNMPIQGTAADGMKRALALVHDRVARLDARVVLMVYDELVVEVPEDHAREAKDVVVQGMVEGMADFVPSVPIVVEANVRPNWASLEH